MHFLFKLFFVTLILASAFIGSTARAVEVMAEVPAKLDAPVTRLVNLDGSPYDLKIQQGKGFTLVNFWALWCPPCKREMRSLARLQEALADHKVKVVAVNVGDKVHLIRNYLKRNQLTGLKIVRGEMDAVKKDWHLQGLPASYMISPDGKISFVAYGERDWDSDETIDWFKTVSR